MNWKIMEIGIAWRCLAGDCEGAMNKSWVGYIPRELAIEPTSTRYSIDGGKLESFRLNGLPDNSTSVYNHSSQHPISRPVTILCSSSTTVSATRHPSR
ncbi:hypothetical protein BD779DRAFT_212505 [Infundibulicybe gibba]|nr:hypothetical protein BD779DRAFT_212505 [Infundibulicybe gibba]